jgi:hypothetical protein
MSRMLTVILTLSYLKETQLHVSIHRPESDYNTSSARLENSALKLEEYFAFVHGAYSHLNLSTVPTVQASRLLL